MLYVNLNIEIYIIQRDLELYNLDIKLSRGNSDNNDGSISKTARHCLTRAQIPPSKKKIIIIKKR